MKRVGLAVALVVAAGLTVVGCGGSSALSGLSDEQREQLAAAWTARIAATDPAPVPVEERNARVKALYTACEALDASAPLNAAVKGSCQPTAIATKLAAVIPERCKRPTASCVRALDRVAATVEQQATAVDGLSNAASAAIEDPECKAQFVTSPVQLEGYEDLAQAYRIWATGVEQRDDDITGLGQRRVEDARALIGPPGTAAERTATFREVCGLD